MQKIIPHLWFDKEAKDAANFYTSVFKNAKIVSQSVIKGTPSGDCDFLTVNIEGLDMMLLSAGPYFKINPSISFVVGCETKEEVDELWAKLSEGGQVMMELASYPFSEWYGWVADKYGVSWQIMYSTQPITQKIVPTLMFVGNVVGKTEEAVNFYTSIFKNSSSHVNMRYGAGEEPDKEGTIKHMSFTLEGQEFAAMDSAHKHEFAFNEAVSLLVNCETQEEIDYYWEKLSAVPEAEQCGWLKDKYGVSWQISSAEMDKMMNDSDPEKVARVTQSFLKMKKFDLAELRKAYEGK